MNMGKIVVVDDEKIVTSAFNTLLKVEGFSDAHFFNNPKDAIEFLKKKSARFSHFRFLNARNEWP